MDIRRGQQGSGAVEPDVRHDVFWFECKHGKCPNIRKALEQATRDVEASKDKRVPIAVTKANGESPLVTCRLSDFLDLVGAK